MPRFRSALNVSLSELSAMVNSRRRELTRLHKRRRDLQRDVDRLDQAIARIEGSRGRGSRGSRPRNEMSLSATIAEVLGKTRKPTSVADIVQAVQATGYRSGSANFRALVNMTLVKEKQFKNVSRGMYALQPERSKPHAASGRGKRRRSRPTLGPEAASAEQPAAA